MVWKLKKDSHFFERMAIDFTFGAPISIDAIKKISHKIINKPADYGLDDKEIVSSTVSYIYNSPFVKFSDANNIEDGIVFQSDPESEELEKVCFHAFKFYYMTLTYKHWNLTKERINEIMLPVVSSAAKKFDLDKINLIFLNSFVFEGNENKLNFSLLNEKLSKLLSNSNQLESLPISFRLTWCENSQQVKFEVEQRFEISTQDEQKNSSKPKIDMRTSIKFQMDDAKSKNLQLKSIFDKMHKISMRTIGLAFSHKFRDNINFNFDNDS